VRRLCALSKQDAARAAPAPFTYWGTDFMTEAEKLENIEETLSWCDWSELRHIGSLAEEMTARGLDDFGQDPEIKARAAIIFENARTRQSIGRRPCQLAPSELGFRTPRAVHAGDNQRGSNATQLPPKL